uniref:Uncharacterized protein n=1 Tax=Candidatus Kentrum sp. LFY TaxID=2126342 RepID=A0A450UHN7_9GAMM|nr:MAG: hypothetical protein BECKLFY1418A_GA0070994_102013 [Candidatus Kentron sp. LFY]
MGLFPRESGKASGEACARTGKALPGIGKAKPAFRKTWLICDESEINKIVPTTIRAYNAFPVADGPMAIVAETRRRRTTIKRSKNF